MGSLMRKPGSSGPIEVAAGLIFRGGRVLISQRRPGDHLAGLWEFPGGKRHAGETFRQCLQRELREELDIETAIGPLLGSVTHAYPDRAIHLRFYRCALVRGEPRPLQCAALAWVAPDALGAYSFPPADARFLVKLIRHPEWWEAPILSAFTGHRPPAFPRGVGRRPSRRST